MLRCRKRSSHFDLVLPSFVLHYVRWFCLQKRNVIEEQPKRKEKDALSLSYLATAKLASRIFSKLNELLLNAALSEEKQYFVLHLLRSLLSISPVEQKCIHM